MEKTRFLFVSIDALISDIAWQVVKEGHEVRYFIESEKDRDIADFETSRSESKSSRAAAPTEKQEG